MLTVGFVLLLIVVRAPLAAGAAVLLNLLATAAAFGVAKLIFQDGVGEAVLGFKSQGFVDAWAPVFFFCLSFALAMDYTVFLLTLGARRSSSAPATRGRHWSRVWPAPGVSSMPPER